MSGQVRLLAYFNNLILIGCFLGMGLGVIAGRRWPGLVHLTLPALGLLAVPLTFSDRLGWMRLRFPDPSVFLWGAEAQASARRSNSMSEKATLNDRDRLIHELVRETMMDVNRELERNIRQYMPLYVR